MIDENELDYNSIMELLDPDSGDGSSVTNDNIVRLDDKVIEESYIENDKESLTERNKNYNHLLEIYVNHIENSLLFKQSNRKFTFYLFVTIMAIIIILIAGLIFWTCLQGSVNIFSSISILITSLITLITSLLIIPTKIAEFIYNSDEDVQIGEIIRNLQEYDKSLRDNLKQK